MTLSNTGITGSEVHGTGAGVLSSNKVCAVISGCLFGEGLGVAGFRNALYLDGTGAFSTPTNLEKFNTRSGTSSVANGGVDAGGGIAILFPALAAFQRVRWTRSRTSQPVTQTFGSAITMGLAAPGGENAIDRVFTFEEGGAGIPNQRARRSRSSGFCNFGCNIELHKKTGGGAFEIITPQFDNNIVWVDPFAWRNGSAQSEAWSMQLFGTPAVPDPIGKTVSASQAVKRASTY